MTKLQKGFTLIELLVVIAIIAVLAGGVVLAINPLENIRKGQDTSAITRARDVITASDAYCVDAMAGGSTPITPTLAILISNGYLKTGTTLPTTVTVSYPANCNGSSTATVTVNSTYYRTKCGGSSCGIPGAF